MGSALDDLRAFPVKARRRAGYQLRRVQMGLMPDDWKPMSAVGPGVYEIRLHTGTAHRVFYIAKFAEAVYVLHAFEKRTRRTPKVDIELAQQRLAQVRALRRQSREDKMAKRKSRRASDNVFQDLGFEPEEAENLRVRADLMIALSTLIEDRGLTQVQAAKLLGVTQPRVSDLVRGKIERFSIDTLIAMLGAAGVQVRVTTQERAQVA